MNITHPIKVKCYWNLHKKCFSVQHKGIVIAHVHQLVLHSPTFNVSEAGRQRVLATRRKNVHAFVVGMWDGSVPSLLPGCHRLGEVMHRVVYNPYKYLGFVYASDERYVNDVRMPSPAEAHLFARDKRANIFVVLPS